MAIHKPFKLAALIGVWGDGGVGPTERGNDCN